MKRRQGKIPLPILIFLTLLTIVLLIFEFSSKRKVAAFYYEQKIAAAEVTARAFDMIKITAQQRNVPVDRINDPNETGLIGLQFSPITTERGDLDVKLTSTNPNVAALVVQLLADAKVIKGDAVAVSFSGSMPALNIAVLSAMEVLELKPVIITSLSASMWGANYPDFTYLDMEGVLIDKGILHFKTAAASLGGENDAGRGMSPQGRELSIAAIERNNVKQLMIQNIEDAIQKRLEIYGKHGDITLFINVAEQTTMITGLNIPPGLLPARSIREGSGLIATLTRQGVPVINLVNLDVLALKYGLPLTPIPLPPVGEGRLFHEYRYSVIQAIISLIILLAVLIFVIRYDVEQYFMRRRT